MERHDERHGKETLWGVLIVILGLALTIIFVDTVWFLGFAIMVAGALMIADGTNIKHHHHPVR